MNEEQRKSKIARFIADEQMSRAIYESLLETFLKTTTQDVQVLAAAKLSIDNLRKGWKELEAYELTGDEDKQVTKQVGL